MKIKKILSLLLTLLLLTGLMPQIALADDTVSIDLSTVNANGTGYTFEELIVNAKPEYVVTIIDSGNYTLTGTVTQESHPTHVVVSASTADITLNGVSVQIVNFSPLSISSGSIVNLTLAEGTENTLSLGSSEVAFAGIYVPSGASLVIDGIGTLNANGGSSGAGIGGSFNQFNPSSGLDRNAGNITINSGVVNAIGGSNGAGIGGASEGEGGTVTINGGEVTATSSYSSTGGAAGIGGGYLKFGNIMITGGTVIATSGKENFSEAIGGCLYVVNSQVTLIGGSIRISPMLHIATPKNGSGEAVYQTTVTVKDESGNLLTNSVVSYTVDATTFTAKTDGDGKLYLWLPAGNASIYISSGGVEYRTVGTVKTDDSTALAIEYKPEVSINGINYATWTEAVTAVQPDETITLLKDITILATDTMPTVVCTIDGDFHTLTLSSDQTLNADIKLKNLCLSYIDTSRDAILSCTDSLNTAHKLTVNGTVGVGNVYIKDGAEFEIDGILEVNEVNAFNTMKVTSGSSVTAFVVRNISNLELNGTITCKYFMLNKASGDSGTLTGTGTFLFTEPGGESPNLSFENVKIDESAQIKLDVFNYSPVEGQLLIGNKAQAPATATALDHVDKLALSGGYSALKLTEHNYGYEYDYILSIKTALKTPSISLAPDTVNGGLTYTITPAPDETGTVSGYSVQMVGDDGITEIGDVINSSSTSGNIPLSDKISIGSSYCAKVKAVAGAASDYFDSAYSSICMTSQAAEKVIIVSNEVPTRKAGISATVTASVEANNAYTLDLSNIFVDVDNDAMTYKVSIDGGSPTTANANYVYTTSSAGITIFVFTANDGTADSEETYTVTLTVTHTDPDTPQTYALTVSAGTGGSITTGNNGNYSAGTSISIVATPSANYSFNGWTSTGGGSFGSATSASTTFIMPAGAVSISANFTFNDTSGGSNSSGGGRDRSSGSAVSTTKVPTTDYTAELSIGIQEGNALKNGETVDITAPFRSGVSAYALNIPVEYLSVSNGSGKLNFNTNTGRVSLPSNMLVGIEGTKAEISIGQGDKADLPESVKVAIGERPLIQLDVKIDGKQIEWNNPSTPVSISIPYTPTKAELEIPESIVIWYIDGSGNAVAVPNGHYDSTAGTVTFSTTHFSDYAVGYNNVSFTDVSSNAWYNKAVHYIATRGITTGTGNGKFSPEAKLTRGEFIVMMMKAYSIAEDKDLNHNFSDAGQTYYTGYLASAKRLGIADGIGHNMFAPDKAITRQEMITLLYNALERIGELPKGNSEKQLAAFSDQGEISSWAENAMALFVSTGTISGSGDHIYPNALTSRAEMTQILYNLMTQ